MSDDYVDINYRGILRNKTDALRAQNIQMKDYKQTLHDEKVRIYGNTGVVTGCGVLTTAANNYVWRFTDVFVRANGAWRVVSSQESAASKTTIAC